MRHFLILVLALSACVAETPVEDNDEIIGGMDSVVAQNSVVRLTIRTDGGIYQCSGTLLAPNLVLTARHCVSNTADGNVGCSSDGTGDQGGAVFDDFAASSITVAVGLTRQRFGRDAGAIDFGVRPHGMQIFHDDATNLCNHDLALILLDQKIPNALISPIRLDAPPTTGETFTAVGWGVTDQTPAPMTRQQRDGVSILAVGPSTQYGGIAPNEFFVGEAVCEGDSGGPALDSTTNAVIGVVSRGGNGSPPDPTNAAATCDGAENLYTQVAPFKDLILSAYQAAGATPWLEGQPNPDASKFGVSCMNPWDCQSGLCLGAGDGGVGVCTADCSTQPCPSGYDCKANASLGTKVCSAHVNVPAKSGCSAAPGETPSRAWLFALALAITAWVRRARRRAA